jgi:DNA-binding SARP family transcriptional activator/pimeloyl-ACP methyl ester carboxylesterase
VTSKARHESLAYSPNVAVAVAVLGVLRVLVNDVDATPASPKAKALVASLALRCGEVVSVDRLGDELWPELPPDRARRVVQVRVAELRKLFASAGASSLVEFVAPGYRMVLRRDSVDVNRFTDLVAKAQQSDDRIDAMTMLREALGLWSGDALADAHASRFLEDEADRLELLRLVAFEDRIDAELADGCHRRLVSELEALVAAHQYREQLWQQLVTALYRCGRQVEALRACCTARQVLREVGVEPGTELRELEAAVLAQDPKLDWQPHSLTARRIVPDRRPPSGFAGDPPPVRYVKAADGVSLAYQVAGEGPIDLIIVPGYVSELDNWWEAWAGRLVRRLAGFSRLILFDKRGVGLADRPENITMDDWVEDTRTVLDAVGSQRPAVLGMSAGGKVAMVFASMYPNRTGALITYAASPRMLTDGTDYPATATSEDLESLLAKIESTWGSGDSLEFFCPSVGDDPALRAQFGQYERRSASPGSASRYLRMVLGADVRAVLPHIASPTLVIHPAGDRTVPVGIARYIADQIPNAELCLLDTEDHLFWFSEAIDDISEAVERFLDKVV